MGYYIIHVNSGNEFAKIDDWRGDSELLDAAYSGMLPSDIDKLKLTGIIKTKKKRPDFLHVWGYGCWIISGKVFNILSKVENDGIYFKRINIELRKESNLVTDCYLLIFYKDINISKIIDLKKTNILFCTEKSRKNMDYGNILDIKNIHLKGALEISLDILKLNPLSEIVLVSEDLMENFKANNVSGLEYEPLEEYDGLYPAWDEKLMYEPPR